MKSFIERIFKAKKAKRIIQEAVAVADEFVQMKATEAAVKALEEEKVIYSKPGHYFDDCNCFKCVRWRQQNAK